MFIVVFEWPTARLLSYRESSQASLVMGILYFYNLVAGVQAPSILVTLSTCLYGRKSKCQDVTTFYIRSGTVIPSKLIPFLIVFAVRKETATRKV